MVQKSLHKKELVTAGAGYGREATGIVGGRRGGDGDILIHCGDFTNKGTKDEISSFATWMASLPHPTKLVVGGNHEISVFGDFNPTRAAELLPGCTYVENQVVEVQGLRIFGVPWKCQYDAQKKLAQAAARQPVDILFSHEPPEGVLDSGFGCPTLRTMMLPSHTPTPRVSVFGHVHEAAGVHRTPDSILVNCAVANDGMRAKCLPRPVRYFDIQPLLPSVPNEPAATSVSTTEPTNPLYEGPEPVEKKQLVIGCEKVKMTSHCLVLPDDAPDTLMAAVDVLLERLATEETRLLPPLQESKWLSNRAFHKCGAAEGAHQTRARTPLAIGCSERMLHELGLDGVVPLSAASTFRVDTIEYVDSVVELADDSFVSIRETALCVQAREHCDCAAAIKWLCSNVEVWGRDPNEQKGRSIAGCQPEDSV
ncbi:hypothetical protein CYMTET_55775 [Cymbomonas tetramitiformis]|uniref:Calcineurin-like phosphoesterase domain-containing protein n=1 Tax=Cymbomonas tetramitiformis TaxID=36881 RepID=A0AAE0BC89_9CHLO|nr:hypothetical protein CYMTET_55775 [Cymbomonas tetramitiformis]